VSKPQAILAGRYRLVRLIATGGMGVVWEAWDELLQRPVAVKELRTEVGVPEDEAELAKNRAMREARITARLHHPHAVPVFDAIEHEGRPCLIMQFVPSRTLSDVLRDDGRLSPHDAARIGGQIASALAAAHKLGIVHRDVKPGNILIAEDGSAMISDFGISHALGDATLTSTGLVHGTPAYLAPEVARGAESGFSSDVFSLGSTLYAAVEGQPPFGMDNNSIALLHKVASGAFAPPQHGGALSALILEMLASDPQARPDMKKVTKRLAALERESEKTALLPVAPPPVLPPVVPPWEAEPATAILPPVAAESLVEEPAHREPAPVEPVGHELPEEPAAEAHGEEEEEEEEDRPLAEEEVAAPLAVDTAALGATQGMTAPPAPPAPVASVPTAPSTRPVAVPAAGSVAAVAAAAPRVPDSAQAAPARTAPPSPPVPDDGEPGERPDRRRLALLLVVLAVLALAAILLTSLIRGPLGQPSDARPDTAGGTPSSAPSTPAQSSATPDPETRSPQPSSPPPPAPTTSAPSTEPSSPPPPGDGEAPSVDSEDDLVAAIEDYYSLVPDDTAAAWPLMTADYQENHAGGRDAYEAFWAPVDQVDAEDVTASVPGEAQATLVYTYDDGSVTEEVTSFVLVEEDGVLKISDSTVISSVDR
jgi:hypothetical protein